MDDTSKRSSEGAAPPAEGSTAAAVDAKDWEPPEKIGGEPVTVPLLEPVKHGGQMLTSLTLQPLKGKHLKNLPVDTANITIGSVMAIAAVQAQVPDSVIEDLPTGDLARVLGVTNRFLSLIQ